jgi:hypothetical protein
MAKLPQLRNLSLKRLLLPLIYLVAIAGVTYFIFSIRLNSQITTKEKMLRDEISVMEAKIKEYEEVDQIKKNKQLEEDMEVIQNTYKISVAVYEDLVDLRELTKNTKKLDQLYASAVSALSKRDYKLASTQLSQLSKDITAELSKVMVASVPNAENVPVNNAPPGTGYSRQTVQSDAGSFVVSIISGDLSSTRVIVDTASDSDCADNCPVLPLATYASRSGAYAGINGTYFCPASYPTCAGKTNSFDLLVMNKNKTYLNSANNVYSTNPAVVFQGGSVNFVGAASQVGRDTGIDGVLSNYPLLLAGGNVTFGGDDDPKKGSKGNRSFVASKGSTVFIGVVHSATVAETARVLKAMGMENALNLDDGGSTALWSGGYKVGPGRDLPNVILFVRK